MLGQAQPCATRKPYMLAPFFLPTPREVIAHDRPPFSPSKRNSRKIGYDITKIPGHQVSGGINSPNVPNTENIADDAGGDQIPQWPSPLEQSTSIVGCRVWA